MPELVWCGVRVFHMLLHPFSRTPTSSRSRATCAIAGTAFSSIRWNYGPAFFPAESFPDAFTPHRFFHLLSHPWRSSASSLPIRIERENLDSAPISRLFFSSGATPVWAVLCSCA